MNIDEMIKDYSDELMDFARKYSRESLVIKKSAAEDTVKEAEEKADKFAAEEKTEAVYAQAQKETEEIPSEEDMENFAYFRARVFTGKEAFPVEHAGVTLYKNDVLYAFLVTDKSGETARVKIEAYPERNSLEPLSDEQSTEYRADVFAEGFIRRENLLVSAVGGSDIVLETELTPESEAIG